MLPNAVCLPPPTHLACDCPVQVLLSDEARIILVIILESLHDANCVLVVCARGLCLHMRLMPLIICRCSREAQVRRKKAKNESVISRGSTISPYKRDAAARFELASIQHTPPARRDMSARDRH